MKAMRVALFGGLALATSAVSAGDIYVYAFSDKPELGVADADDRGYVRNVSDVLGTVDEFLGAPHAARIDGDANWLEAFEVGGSTDLQWGVIGQSDDASTLLLGSVEGFTSSSQALTDIDGVFDQVFGGLNPGESRKSTGEDSHYPGMSEFLNSVPSKLGGGDEILEFYSVERARRANSPASIMNLSGGDRSMSLIIDTETGSVSAVPIPPALLLFAGALALLGLRRRSA